MSIWNGKYVSVNNIISKVYRDMDMSDQLNISDAVEWCGEALELIGSPGTLTEAVTVIEVADYKAEIPSDLHQIQTCWAYSGTVQTDDSDSDNYLYDITRFIPMRYSTDVMHHYMETCKDHRCDSEYVYKLNDSYIYPNFQCGAVQLSYWAIPTDDAGFPKIPDQIKFREAVSAHLTWKLARTKMIAGKMPQAIYMEFKQERDWYIGAAQTAGQMPGLDMMESIKNNWIRLIPKINQHSDGFRSAGTAEQRISHNSVGISGVASGSSDRDNNRTFFYYYNISCEEDSSDTWTDTE
tara:strand:+ start:5182 stop:6066 length:885 start_codon:yes stop_codon:yes gene_type:complete